MACASGKEGKYIIDSFTTEGIQQASSGQDLTLGHFGNENDTPLKRLDTTAHTTTRPSGVDFQHSSEFGGRFHLPAACEAHLDQMHIRV